MVQRRTGSDIAGTLATDHRNDTCSNLMVIVTMLLIVVINSNGWHGPWVARLDPLISLVLSVWIINGWVSNALEQFTSLSDQRSERIDIEAISQVAQGTLHGSPRE